MKQLSDLAVDELAAGICLRAGQIACVQAELMTRIAEFDRREGWAGPGMLSCAHWLSWRTGMSPGTAREHVRIARRLEDLPELADAFGDGRVSYSKVRAITRAAEPGDGIDWVDLARHSSGGQLEKLVRGVRRARANAQAALDPEAAAWQLRTRVRYDDNGNFMMTISGPAHVLPELQAGLEAKKSELQRERDAEASSDAPAKAAAPPQPEEKAHEAPAPQPSPPAPEVDLDAQAPGWPAGTTIRQVREAQDTFTASRAQEAELLDQEPSAESPPAGARALRALPAQVAAPDGSAGTPEPAKKVTDAEALLALAREALAVEKAAHPDIARRRRPQLTTQIDPLSGWGRQPDGELLPPSSLQAVLKSLPGRGGPIQLRPLSPADLRRHDLGRTQREANLALRQLIGTLDGERCRFPGCTRHMKLHAHHVVYWSQGGRTDLDNLVLVCSRHHTLIHSQGFVLVLHPDRRLEVRTADGVAVLHHPAQPWGDPAEVARGCGQLVSAETLPPDHARGRLDLGYAVQVLMAQAS
jgi:hypothetical protein